MVNKAVDEVRRQEAKSTPSLKRSRYLWLKGKGSWNSRQVAQFADFRQLNLKTHRAFRIKEALREIGHRPGTGDPRQWPDSAISAGHPGLCKAPATG